MQEETESDSPSLHWERRTHGLFFLHSGWAEAYRQTDRHLHRPIHIQGRVVRGGQEGVGVI